MANKKESENRSEPEPISVVIVEIARPKYFAKNEDGSINFDKETGENWDNYRRIEVHIEPTFSLREASTRASKILKETDIEAEVVKQGSKLISI